MRAGAETDYCVGWKRVGDMFVYIYIPFPYLKPPRYISKQHSCSADTKRNFGIGNHIRKLN